METEKILAEWEKETEENGIDETAREAAEEVRSFLQETLKFAYEDGVINENDLDNILMDDDYLLEELTDKTAALNILWGGADSGMVSEEKVESAYLSLIDTLFELSKAVNPIAGFGRDRLLAGLSLLDYFEENRWPVSTAITAGNADRFRQFIPEEHFDDVLCRRKQAIGALRRLGEKTVAAGAAVFSVETDPADDTPVLRLEWIEVHKDLRRQGAGNMLMAEILEPFVKKGDVTLIAELPAIRLDEENGEESDTLENFLDSWRIEFSVTSGRRFTLEGQDLNGNKEIKGLFKEAVPLWKLGDQGEEKVREFFREQDLEYDRELKNLPFSFFDLQVSTCILKKDRITALFLVHRFANGNYRYEALRCPGGYDGPEMKELLRCAYRSWREQDGNGMIFGAFESEEGREAVTALLPELNMPVFFSGFLRSPEEAISTELWDEMRRDAGFSDEKIPDDGLME